MEEQKIIRKQLIKNMILTFFVFTILFLLFDMFIYNQISASLFSSIDQELNSSADIKTGEQKENNPLRNSNINQTKEELDTNVNTSNTVDISNSDNNKLSNWREKRLNPRLTTIIRDMNGNITNQKSIGKFYEDYLTNISFDKDNLETIYNLEINNEYHYRGITFITEQDGETVYIQLLANVDGEMQTLQNVVRILVIGTVTIIIISVLASYILSKRTLRPIIEAYKKQIEFVQNASHELRTPLTIIQTKQELLLQEPSKKIIDKSEDIHLMLKETKLMSY